MDLNLIGSMEAMSRSRLATVVADALMVDVAQLLSQTQISLVVVCDHQGKMVGVVTKTDIVKQLGHCTGSACRIAASSLMISDVTCCRATDSLSDVLALMAELGRVHIPVVDEHRRPLGVVNARDALRVLLAQGEYEDSLLRAYVMGVGYH